MAAGRVGGADRAAAVKAAAERAVVAATVEMVAEVVAMAVAMGTVALSAVMAEERSTIQHRP